MVVGNDWFVHIIVFPDISFAGRKEKNNFVCSKRLNCSWKITCCTFYQHQAVVWHLCKGRGGGLGDGGGTKWVIYYSLTWHLYNLCYTSHRNLLIISIMFILCHKTYRHINICFVFLYLALTILLCQYKHGQYICIYMMSAHLSAIYETKL